VEEDKAAEIDLYHCPNCQITHGPSISKLVKCVSFFYLIIHSFDIFSHTFCFHPALLLTNDLFPLSSLQCESVVGEISRQMGVLWEEKILLGL